MSRVVRAALVQTKWTGDKESMIDAARGVRPRRGRPGRAGHLLPGALLRPVLLPGAGGRSTTSTPSRSPTARPRALPGAGQGAGHGDGRCRCTRRSSPAFYYNTAAVIDADGTYLGKYRKHHIPQVKGFWEKFYFRPGNLGYPVFDTAVGKVGVYICYDRHFPEGWRALGPDGRPDRLQPVGHQPRPVGLPVEAGAAGAGRRQRVLHRRHQPRRHRGARRQRLLRHLVLRRPARASSSATWPTTSEAELLVRDLDLDRTVASTGRVRDPLAPSTADRRRPDESYGDLGLTTTRRCTRSDRTLDTQCAHEER